MVYINGMIDTLKNIIIWPWELIPFDKLILSTGEVVFVVMLCIVIIATIYIIYFCKRLRMLNWLDVIILYSLLICMFFVVLYLKQLLMLLC